jgi:hypothetical protein
VVALREVLSNGSEKVEGFSGGDVIGNPLNIRNILKAPERSLPALVPFAFGNAQKIPKTAFFSAMENKRVVGVRKHLENFQGGRTIRRMIRRALIDHPLKPTRPRTAEKRQKDPADRVNV